MSNKKKKCDIYYENNNKQNIYIEINDISDCCFEIWDIEGETKSRAKIKFSIKEWEDIIEKWTSAKVKKEGAYDYI
jgi:hypothetical protein